jgi:hypothetical protein
VIAATTAVTIIAATRTTAMTKIAARAVATKA